MAAETALRVQLRAQDPHSNLPPIDYHRLTSLDSGFSADRNFLYHELITLQRDLVDLQTSIQRSEQALGINRGVSQ